MIEWCFSCRFRSEGSQWLPGLDDVGGQHVPGAGTGVTCVVGCAGRDEETVAGLQDQGRLPLDRHLDCPGNDVSHFLAGMGMPPRFHARRDFREYLDDLPPGDRRRAVLDLGALERAGQRVARWLRAGVLMRHEDLLD
jgi:hypothetical protein